MDVAAWGSLAMGVVVGYLVLRFVRRFRSFAPKSLASVIAVIAGGAAVQFVARNPDTIWYYPIGVLAGFIAYIVLAFVILGRRGGDDDDVGGPGGGSDSGGGGGGGVVVTKPGNNGGLGNVVLTPPGMPK